MSIRRALSAVVVVVGATAPVGGASPAGAAGPPVAAVAVEQYRYIPGDTTGSVPAAAEVRMARGGRLFLVNVDVSAPHTLTGPVQEDGTYLFDTRGEVDQFDAEEVVGVGALAPGSYDFFCKLHTNLMRGRLVVEP